MGILIEQGKHIDGLPPYSNESEPVDHSIFNPSTRFSISALKSVTHFLPKYWVAEVFVL